MDVGKQRRERHSKPVSDYEVKELESNCRGKRDCAEFKRGRAAHFGFDVVEISVA